MLKTSPGLVILALLGLATGVWADDRSEFPRPAWVGVEEAELFASPDHASPVTNFLRKGERVKVVREGPGGWLEVAPPAGSFSWIDRDAIRDLGDGRGRVVAEHAAVRPGVEGARLPTGVWSVVDRDTTLRLFEDLVPLIVRQADGQRRVLYAVEPPPNEVRHIRSEDLTWSNPQSLGEEGVVDRADRIDLGRGRGQRRFASRAGPSAPILDADFLAVGPPTPELGLPYTFESALRQTEARHRAVLAGPLESWGFESVRREYEALRERAASGLEREAVSLRLDQLTRQEKAAKAARRLADLLAASRRRDAQIASIDTRLGEIATGANARYEAEGLLQAASLLVDGRAAYLLIDDSGRTAAYLLSPPGLDLDDYVAARVGIRGDSRFHPIRKARVITVREIERLDEAP